MAFSTDRDLLTLEPRLFAELAWPAQRLAAGTDGQLTAGTFTADSANLQSAGVAPGMVLHVETSDGPAALEIVSVDAPTQLTVSTLRADGDADPITPPISGTDLAWHVVTFAPQAEIVALEMLAAFGLYPSNAAASLSADDIAEPSALRAISACGVLAVVLGGAASRTDAADGYWTKAAHYRRLFERMLARVRLGIDADGDGYAELTRHQGAGQLRRD